MDKQRRLRLLPSGPGQSVNEEALHQLKLAAFVAGFFNATSQFEQQITLTDQAIKAAAMESAIAYQQREDIQVPTVPPALFRTAFARVCAYVHKRQLEIWQGDHETFALYQSLANASEEQMQLAWGLAEENLNYLEAVEGHAITAYWEHGYYVPSGVYEEKEATMKKKKHLQMVTPEEQSPAIDPEELRQVRLHGFAQGVLNAFKQLEKRIELSKQGVQAAALEAAILYQEKQPALMEATKSVPPNVFRTEFARICAFVHWQYLSLFQKDDWYHFRKFQMLSGDQQVQFAWDQALECQNHLDAVDLASITVFSEQSLKLLPGRGTEPNRSA